VGLGCSYAQFTRPAPHKPALLANLTLALDSKKESRATLYDLFIKDESWWWSTLGINLKAIL